MALSADRTGVVHAGVLEERDFPVAASTRIYLGGLYSLNATGFLVPAADAAAQANKLIVFALEAADNTSGADGAVSCRCMTRGTALIAKGAIVAADRGKIAHATADDTLALTSTNGRGVGPITRVESSLVAVAIG